jgi:hypothetical protein
VELGPVQFSRVLHVPLLRSNLLSITLKMKTRTTTGYRYWVTYIDEATSHRVVSLLKHKSDTFEAFRAYKAYAENALGSKIMELQMDQGGEFVSNVFRQFCQDAGILM